VCDSNIGPGLLLLVWLCLSVQAEPEAPKEWVSYLKPNLTIAMVDHFVTYPKTNIPPPVSAQVLHLLLAAV
jgi:hypothetical protein